MREGKSVCVIKIRWGRGKSSTRECDKGYWFFMLLVQVLEMEFLSGVVVFVLATTVLCIPLQDTVDVTIIKSENNELEATVEWGNGRMGMLIEARQNKLSITPLSNDGETFVFGERKNDFGTFYTALGRSFFTTEAVGRDGTKMEYAIPDSMIQQAKEAFEEQKMERLLSNFDGESAQISSGHAILELIRRPEIRVLEEAARILGEGGLIGRDNRGALLFYTTVLNMVKERDRERGQGGGRDRRESETGPEGRWDGYGERDRARANGERANGYRANVERPSQKNFRRFDRSNNRDDVECENQCPLGFLLKCRECLAEQTGSGVSPTKSLPPLPSTTVPAPTPTATPCASPCPFAELDSPYTYHYLPYSLDRCATCPPFHLHSCLKQGRWWLLCENCYHGYECEKDFCPIEDPCPPYETRENECIGMCGRQCTCWSWVCGDCCWWPGCYQHDRACRESFFSFSCLLPFGFDCCGY